MGAYRLLAPVTARGPEAPGAEAPASSPHPAAHRTTGESLPLLPLLGLAAAIFVAMTVEFLPGGLLPLIAEGYGISVAQTGQIVTVFAAAVILTTSPLAFATRRVPRKRLLIAAMIAVAVTTAAAGLAPDIIWLMVARAATGVAHGVFWTVAAAYSAHLVPPDRLNRAIAITASGGTLAGILGFPLGNLFGELLGWRAAFLGLATCGAALALVLAATLPPVGMSTSEGREHPDRAAPSTVPAVVAICVVIVLLVVGQTTWGTYTVPWLEQSAAISPIWVPLFLAGNGVGAVIGVAVVGKWGDRHPRPMLFASVAVVIGTTVALTLVTGSAPAVLIVMVALAAAWMTIPTLLQAMLLRVASRRDRVTATSLQTVAFNVGIGAGAASGGVILSVVSLGALPWASAVGSVLGLIALVAVIRVDRPSEVSRA